MATVKEREAKARRARTARLAYVKAKYGLDAKTYDEWLAKGCAICGREKKERNKSFHIDHDHKSGKVRGMLCPTCNKGLALFRDDASSLQAAAEYIAESQIDKDTDIFVPDLEVANARRVKKRGSRGYRPTHNA